jgi:glycosyltransferase involved in cell wall biosynthesis
MTTAIVALSDFDKVNSTVRRVTTLAKGLAAASHDVHIVIPQRFRAGSKTETLDGLTLHWASQTSDERWNTARERLDARWQAIRVVRTLARNGLDWLILYNLGLEGLLLAFVAHRHGVRVAAEYCDVRVRPSEYHAQDAIRFAWHRVADALVPRRTDLNIGISRSLEAWLRRKAPSTPTTVVPPLVDCATFRPSADEAQEFRKKWGIGDAPIIAYLGSYWKVEGVPVLLEAARSLMADGERFTLVISGASVAGLDCDNVPMLVRDMKLTRQTVETGWLCTSEVVGAMSAADVLVVPKTADAANQAGVATKMVEYMAMGRAVVATRIGDVPVHLRDGEDCQICEPGDVADLAEKLRDLLHAPSERLRLGENARRTAIERFDYRVVARQLDAVFRQIGPRA